MYSYGDFHLIENSSFHKHNGLKPDEDIIKHTSLGDYAIYSNSITKNELKHGKITFLNFRGVNISTPLGNKFFKWYHVKNVVKFKNILSDNDVESYINDIINKDVNSIIPNTYRMTSNRNNPKDIISNKIKTRLYVIDVIDIDNAGECKPYIPAYIYLNSYDNIYELMNEINRHNMSNGIRLSVRNKNYNYTEVEMPNTKEMLFEDIELNDNDSLIMMTSEDLSTNSIFPMSIREINKLSLNIPDGTITVQYKLYY